MNTNLHKELVRQFGKKDAAAFSLAPHKYAHHFDARALDAYLNALRSAITIAQRDWRTIDQTDEFKTAIASIGAQS